MRLMAQSPLEEIDFQSALLAKVCPAVADLLHMLNPVSSAHASQTSETAKSAALKPQTAQPQKSTLPSDTVTLKSTGDADHDGDSK
jgi:hypothetical protein